MASGSVKIMCCVLLGLIFASTLLETTIAQEAEGSPQTASPPESEGSETGGAASPPEVESPDAAPNT